MLAWFLHICKETDDYENHRSKPYRETACGVGVHLTLRLPGIHAEKMPDCTVKGGWSVIEKGSGGAFHIGAPGQPLGEAISGEGHRRAYGTSRGREPNPSWGFQTSRP